MRLEDLKYKRLQWFKETDRIPVDAKYVKSEKRKENVKTSVATGLYGIRFENETCDLVEYHLYEVFE